jgi:hypothetical protein
MEIGIVSEFNYLGVLFSKSGNFSMAKKAQVEKATKTVFEVLKRGKIYNLKSFQKLSFFGKFKKIFLKSPNFTPIQYNRFYHFIKYV